jgi:hypothetical protein
LGDKNIARCPTNLCAQSDQGFDEYSGLNRHMQRPGDSGALQVVLKRQTLRVAP